MAELFLAKDTSSGELVVIKRILPYLSQEAEFVRMFLDEARIAAQLHHTAIIQVNELGKLDESIFIAMEYVEGVDLRALLQEEMKRNAAVPWGVAAYVIAQLCGGLHYAHNRIGINGKPMGIVHRDISPQNVMVGFNGAVKLVDFGIAKAGALVERSKPGVIKGKFLYLAPEQLMQDRVDHRADLFALGTMLYEVTTAKSPFFKTSTEAVIYAIRAEDPPPPHLIIPDYPVALSQIIMKCLSKDRERRYQQADEVRADLEKFLLKLPTGQEELVRYVAGLLGEEDERTSLFIPEAARGAPSAKRKALESTRSGRPGPPVPEPRDERTQTARPEDLAALTKGPSSRSSPPARRQTGPRYAHAGENDDASTTNSRPGAAEPTQIAQEPQRPLPPGLKFADEPSGILPSEPDEPSFERVDEEPSLPSAPSGTPDPGEPVFDELLAQAQAPKQRSRPAPRSLPSDTHADEEDSTGDFQSRFDSSGEVSDPRGRLSKSPVLLGAIAFVSVLVVCLGLLALMSRSDRQSPPPDKVVAPTPGLPTPGPSKDLEPKLTATPVEPEAVDAGVAVEPAPAAKRTTVVIRAPSGTRINRGKFNPGASYQLLPGPLRLVYRCPPKRRRKQPEQDKIYKIPEKSPFVIKLCRK